MKRIKEIIGALKEGATDPLLCRAEDDRKYAVKHRGCGRDALIKEWIAGRIGRELDLPIPEIEMLTLAPSQAQYVAIDNADNLAACPAFGSCFVESTIAFSPALNTRVSEARRAEILLFDWWVRNGDRTDGNPNLLWDAAAHALWVIDHNLAFDVAEEPDDFWRHHIFREAYRTWDRPFRGLMEPKMRTIIGNLPGLWHELPDEWTIDCNTTYDTVDRILRRHEDAAFWNLP
jgi:hypothetical protein